MKWPWLILCAACGVWIDFLLMRRLKSEKYPATVLFCLLCDTACFAAFDDPLVIAKGCIFFEVLIAAGYIDSKTRTIPDEICWITALCGCIRPNWLSSAAGAVLLFALLMGLRLLIGGIGGGDIKLLTACGWVLGIFPGLTSAIISFSLFFAGSFLMRRKLIKSYPLAPFIAAGSILAYLCSV